MAAVLMSRSCGVEGFAFAAAPALSSSVESTEEALTSGKETDASRWCAPSARLRIVRSRRLPAVHNAKASNDSDSALEVRDWIFGDRPRRPTSTASASANTSASVRGVLLEVAAELSECGGIHFGSSGVGRICEAHKKVLALRAASAVDVGGGAARCLSSSTDDDGFFSNDGCCESCESEEGKLRRCSATASTNAAGTTSGASGGGRLTT